MKYAVTGGLGFIGSHLVEKLLKGGHEVLIIDNLGSYETEQRVEGGFIKQLKRIGNFSILEKDVSKIKDYSIFKGIDTMFHLAALPRVQPSIIDPIKYHNTNVNGTLNMLIASVKSDIRRFVFSSSSSVYGEAKKVPTSESSDLVPKSPYALHKIIGEQYCQLFESIYDISTVSLRYFNVYGERQPLSGDYSLVMGVFADQIMKSKPLTINGDGEQKRDFVYVGDVVEANILSSALENKDVNIFNIGSGTNCSVNEIADLLDNKLPRINNPPVIEPRETLADINSAKKVLNWEPKTSLSRWVKDYKKHLGINS